MTTVRYILKKSHINEKAVYRNQMELYSQSGRQNDHKTTLSHLNTILTPGDKLKKKLAHWKIVSIKILQRIN